MRKMIFRWSFRGLLGLLIAYGLIYALHLPFRAAKPVDHFERVAHRGVHQNFDHHGITNETCTATRIFPPTHAYIENTIDSMQAALASGADRIEIDVHLTSDGQLVVFHDWTVDCRTDGHGETRARTLAELKALDIGYGYTADNGRSFPFRGRYMGAMPSLSEVLIRLPQARLLIDQKDRSEATTKALAQLLTEHPAATQRVCLQAIAERNTQFKSEVADGCVWPDPRAIRRCLLDYLWAPLTTIAPQTCGGRTLLLPDWPMARILWGWPGSFVERMHAAGSQVLIVSDDPERAEHYRQLGFDGVLTNRIELWARSDSSALRSNP